MGKVVWKIVLILIPIMLVIGLFRMMFHQGSIDFVPTWSDLVGYFSSAPNPIELINEPLTIFNESQNNFASLSVYDIPSFFNAVGAFFGLVGNFLYLFWSAITVPFQYIWWFVTFIAGFAS